MVWLFGPRNPKDARRQIQPGEDQRFRQLAQPKRPSGRQMAENQCHELQLQEDHQRLRLAWEHVVVVIVGVKLNLK